MNISESASSSKDVTLEGIASLLDSRLSPLHESMSGLESKFESLHIHVDKEMQTMKNDLKHDFKAIDERFQMSESNIENLYERLNDHMKEYEKTISNFGYQRATYKRKCRDKYPKFYAISISDSKNEPANIGTAASI